MVFLADIAIATGLIALVAGAALLAYSCKAGMSCRTFVKAIAYVTIALSVLSLLCTGYYSLRYWEDGYFKHPRVMMDGKHRDPARRGPKGEKYHKKN
jgi:uncharacterized Zn-finger protein